MIPVYNEGDHIVGVLDAFATHVRTRVRVLIAYDRDDDDTLPVLAAHAAWPFEIVLVKNRAHGVYDAIATAFGEIRSAALFVWPADDDYNQHRVDSMVERLRGNDIVAASRFMRGGRMVGCPWRKALLVRISALALHRVARVPTSDPSNGLRLFSRRVIDSIPIESTEGFAYSLELLVKCHRLRWGIAEVPAEWYERRSGASRFQLVRWLPSYLRWFRYAFATTFLVKKPSDVVLR